MTADPLLPGRRAYEEARKFLRAKRRTQLRGVTAVPTKPATVLQFPDKKEVADAHQIDEA